MHLPPLTWLVDRARSVLAPIGRYFYREREHQWEHFSNKQNHCYEALSLAQVYRELMLVPSLIGTDQTARRIRVRDELTIRLQGLSTLRASPEVLGAARDLRRIYEATVERVIHSHEHSTPGENEAYLAALTRFEDAIAADFERGPR